MDRCRRLDALHHLSAKGPAGHAGGRAESRQAIFCCGSGHGRLVRAGGAKNGERLVIRLSLLLMLSILNGTAAAGMADLAHRSAPSGIDLITYHSNVKDVVIVLGVLPAGDAMAE